MNKTTHQVYGEIVRNSRATSTFVDFVGTFVNIADGCFFGVLTRCLTDRSVLYLLAGYNIFLTVLVKDRPHLALADLTFEIKTKFGRT